MAAANTTADRDQLYAVIAATTLDNNTIVAAVTGKKILVTGFALVATGGANNVRWESGASGTALTGVMSLAATTGSLVALYNPGGHFQTATNTLLNLELSAATAVAGWLTYVLTD